MYIMSDDINIVEAYKRFNKQLIILISGMSGSGKSKLAENISRDFDLEIINQKDYYKKSHNEKFTYFDGTETVNWYTNDAYNWTDFNDDVNNMKSRGVIVVGIAFPTQYLNFKPDFHITVSVKKAVLLERMEKLMEQNKEKYPDKYDDMTSGRMKQMFNKLSYPYYLKSLEESVVNKFINASEMTDDQIYDNAFDYLIAEIEKRVYKLDKNPANIGRLSQNINNNSDNNNNENENDNDNDDNNNDEDDSDSITSESTDPLEMIEHEDDGESPYEDTNSIDENGNALTINAYEYGLKGDYIYW